MSMEFDAMYVLYVMIVAYLVAIILFKFAWPILKFLFVTLVAIFLGSMFLFVTNFHAL